MLALLDSLAENPAPGPDMGPRPRDMRFVHNHATPHDRSAFEERPEPV